MGVSENVFFLSTLQHKQGPFSYFAVENGSTIEYCMSAVIGYARVIHPIKPFWALIFLLTTSDLRKLVFGKLELALDFDF